jgi:hypothetical protein
MNFSVIASSPSLEWSPSRIKPSPCVVIPAHADSLAVREQMAFRRAIDCFKNHPIFLLVPDGLDIGAFYKLGRGFEPVFINPKFLSSVSAYNHLKCSAFFYRMFLKYSHILTFELDSYVFNDELAYWCSQPFDYIGAPWTGGWAQKLVRKVGNSGFSLRTTQSCLEIAETRERLAFIAFVRPYAIRSLLLKVKYFRKLRHIILADCEAEDHFWSLCAPESFPGFNVAPYEAARLFSFEETPSVLFTENGRKLPFGCHAWHRYETAFWKQFIPARAFQ